MADLSGNQISLIDNNGQIKTGPLENAQQLVDSGQYRYLTPEEATNKGMQDFSQTLPEQVKNIASNFGDTASFGAQSLVQRHLLSPQDLQYENVRRQENPGGSFLGTGLGVVTDPFDLAGLAGRGLAKGAEAVGAESLASGLSKGAEGLSNLSKYTPMKGVDALAQSAQEAVNPFSQDIANSLISKESSPIANQVLSNLPGRALRGSVIGGAFAAGQSISEQSLGDVDLNGEKILADSGAGALMGLVFDTSLGSLGDTVVGGTKKIYGALKPGSAAQTAFSNMVSKFSNAEPEVVSATIDAERDAQQIYKSKEKNPTAIENLNTNLKTIFGDGSAATQNELGLKISQGFQDLYNKISEDYNQSFGPLREKYGDAPITAEFGQKIFDDAKKNLVPNSPAWRILNHYDENFQTLDNANSLMSLRSVITKEMRMAGYSGEAGAIGDIMKEGQDSALMLAAKGTGIPSEIQAAQDAADALSKERSLYSGDMKKVKSLAESIGMKNTRNMSFSNFSQRMSEIDGNTFVDKIFKERKNVKGLEFLRDEFPDQFKTIADAFKNKISNQATKAGMFNSVKALDLVSEKNLPAESRKLIFGDAGHDALSEAQKAFQGETAENFQNNLQKKQNAALLQDTGDNTFATLGGLGGGAAGGFGGAAAGAALGSVLDTITNKNKAAKAFLGFEKAFKNFDEKIGSMASRIFEENPISSYNTTKFATTGALASKRSDEEDTSSAMKLDHEKMVNNLSEWSENPDKLIQNMGSQFSKITDIAPGMSQSAQAAGFRAINLLKEKIPVMPPKMPLDIEPYKVSNQQAYQFSRYYDTVIKPESVLDEVNKGTLTNDHLETLARVYPQLYKNMQQIVMQKMIDYGNQKDKAPMPAWKKLSLSYFLGENLSSGLNQQSLGANVNNWLNPNMVSGQQNNAGPVSNTKGNQTGQRNAISQNYMTDTQETEDGL